MHCSPWPRRSSRTCLPPSHDDDSDNEYDCDYDYDDDDYDYEYEYDDYDYDYYYVLLEGSFVELGLPGVTMIERALRVQTPSYGYTTKSIDLNLSPSLPG